MKTYTIIPALIEDINEKIKKQRSRKSWINAAIFGAIFIITTALIVAMNFDEKSSIYFMLMLISISCAIMSLLSILFVKHEFKYLPSNQSIWGKTLYFDTTSVETLKEAIEQHDKKLLIKLLNNEERGIKMELITTDDYQLARYRLFKYVPFEFQSQTENIDIEAATAELLLNIKK